MKFLKFLLCLVFLIPTFCLAAPSYLSLHFLDVGAGDCTLIKSPSGENILIDAGNSAAADTIIKYLRRQGVKQLNLLIGTAPTETQVGAMAAVIKAFPIGQCYLPKAPETKLTKTLAVTAGARKLKIRPLETGATLVPDFELKLTVLAPQAEKYAQINDYSPVIMLGYGKNSFLFTGAAGRQSESEMLAKGCTVKADLLKVSQQGGVGATTPEFLTAVAPKYAVISAAKGQTDLPHPQTLGRLAKANIQVLRTDHNGTVIVSSNGERLQITTVPIDSVL